VRELREAADRLEKFLAACPGDPDVLDAAYTAHEALAEHVQAAAVATRLIEIDPEQPGPWWWRGNAHRSQGRNDAAISDFRQTLALSPDVTNIPMNLANTYSAAGRHCEALVTLERYAEVAPHLAEELRDRELKERVRGDGCKDVEGTGAAVLPFDPAVGLVRAQARVGGRSAPALVDRRAAYVTISRALADGLGLTPGPEVSVVIAGALLPGRLALLATVEVAGARARDVEAVVLDKVPGGVEVIVGQSFLWRFRMVESASRVELRARRR